MGTGASPRVSRALSAMRHGVFAALALALAACNHTGSSSPAASTVSATGSTIAFESIDGPPVGVFHKLVQNLSSEADTRSVNVVSREGPAQYRARGYMAAHVVRGKTHITWVWDIYDTEQRRALRITGEEAGGKAGRDPWAVADDEVVRRIARTSMDRIVALLGGQDAPGPEAPASQAIAARTPEATVGLAAVSE